jgi:hypothetical protein
LSNFLKEINELLHDQKEKYDELLANDTTILKKKYTEGVQELYEDALRRHVLIIYFINNLF